MSGGTSTSTTGASARSGSAPTAPLETTGVTGGSSGAAAGGPSPAITHSTTILSVPITLSVLLIGFSPYIPSTYSSTRTLSRFRLRCALRATSGSNVHNTDPTPSSSRRWRWCCFRIRPTPASRRSSRTASMCDQWVRLPSRTPVIPKTNPTSDPSSSNAPTARPPTFCAICSTAGGTSSRKSSPHVARCSAMHCSTSSGAVRSRSSSSSGLMALRVGRLHTLARTCDDVESHFCYDRRAEKRKRLSVEDLGR